jgi:selenocysteine-specific elongation factor
MGEKVRKLLQYMVESGAIIPVEKGIYFHAKALADVKGRIEHFFTQKKEATIGDMKELFAGASRKKLVMILEHFDRIGLTVRVGEARQLRS